MSDIDELVGSAKSTWHMLGMTVVTGGAYPFLWLMKNRELFNKFSTAAISETIVYLLAGLWVWQSAVANLGQSMVEDDASLALTLSIASISLAIALLVVFYIAVTQKVVNGLSDKVLKEEKIDMRVNQFFAFIFGYFYINFKVNEINTLRARSKLLN